MNEAGESSSAARKLRTVVVEDERPARTRLKTLLSRYPDVEVVAEADSVGAGAEAVRTSRPDLVFLDIRLMGGTAFNLLAQLAAPLPVIVFVTAHSDYAVRAFEVHAIDYLLKPVEQERLDRCLERVRTRATPPAPDDFRERLSRALEQALQRRQTDGGEDQGGLQITALHEGHTVVIEPQLIDYIEGDRNYVWFHCGDLRLRGRYTLNELASRLDPAQFSRAHRSLIVNLARVRAIDRNGRGGVEVTLQNGRRVPCGDVYRRGLLELLGLESRGDSKDAD